MFRSRVVDVSSDGQTLKEVAEQSGISYVRGHGYYELTEKEKISATKDIVIVKGGKRMDGDDARTAAGLPLGTACAVSPEDLDTDAKVFVQSKSANRKCHGGTQCLYRVDDDEEADDVDESDGSKVTKRARIDDAGSSAAEASATASVSASETNLGERLWSPVKARQARYDCFFRSGATEEDWQKLEARLLHPIPAKLKAVFSYCSGANLPSNCSFGPEHALLSPSTWLCEGDPDVDMALDLEVIFEGEAKPEKKSIVQIGNCYEGVDYGYLIFYSLVSGKVWTTIQNIPEVTAYAGIEEYFEKAKFQVFDKGDEGLSVEDLADEEYEESPAFRARQLLSSAQYSYDGHKATNVLGQYPDDDAFVKAYVECSCRQLPPK
eukprot:m.196297 g.196297  ORF g.196297 m.196297 type:complete len:379 (+) comp18322_c0_seq6:2177-3313(+)